MLTRRTTLGLIGSLVPALAVAAPVSRRKRGVVTSLRELMPPRLSTTAMAPSATDSFSVISQGYGSFTGMAYTVPAHSDGHVTADIQTLALTSVDVQNLNDLIKGMLSASQYQKVRDYEATHASANLSYWGFWSGGGSASYEKTHEELRGFGLSETNIQTIVSAMSEVAKKMSHVGLDIHVKNSANNYAVSGSLLLYTIAGTISSQNQQTQYRMLADSGVAGSGTQTCPADVKIIPLN